MRKLSRLWQALERIPGLAAVPAEWRSHCGDEYPFVEPHLRPTENIGAAYPCPHPRDADCPRRIDEHADGSFSAVCRHPHRLCDDLVLSPKEALVYTLDVVTFVRPVAEALAVRFQPSPQPTPGVWGIGVSSSRRTRNQPAFLLAFNRAADFHAALRNLTVYFTTPFLALAPTDRFVTIETREDLSRHKSEIIALHDRIAVSEDGHFSAVEELAGLSIEPTPVPRRKDAVDSYKERFGKPASFLYRTMKVDHSDFYKWMKGQLPNESEKSQRIEEALRTSPDMLQKRLKRV